MHDTKGLQPTNEYCPACMAYQLAIIEPAGSRIDVGVKSAKIATYMQSAEDTLVKEQMAKGETRAQAQAYAKAFLRGKLGMPLPDIINAVARCGR